MKLSFGDTTMSAIRFLSARRHLDAFEESWKSDHVEAMRCHDLEATLAQGVMVFQLVEWLNRSWREHVYRGIEPFAVDDEQAIKGTYTRWLRLTDEVTAELAELKSQFGELAHADTIRRCRERAQKVLANWTPPALARSPGLRVWDVTEEEASELRDLLNAPAGAPGRLAVEPKSIPVADASALR